MQTVGGQLTAGDVVASLAGRSGAADQLGDEVVQVLMGAVDVLATLQARGEVVAVVLVGNQGVGVQNGGEFVPLSVASLLTGLVQSLGTVWGLFRHYWVLIKLMMNLFATGVLLLYMQTLTYLADRAKAAPLGGVADPSPVLHGAAAVVLLAVATVLSIYKPRGLTSYGQRAQLRCRGRSVSRAELSTDG